MFALFHCGDSNILDDLILFVMSSCSGMYAGKRLAHVLAQWMVSGRKNNKVWAFFSRALCLGAFTINNTHGNKKQKLFILY